MREYKRRDDGNVVSEPEYLLAAAQRRRDLAGEGLCMNGRTHGKATHSGRCWRCYLVKRYGIEVARTREDWPPDGTFAHPNPEEAPVLRKAGRQKRYDHPRRRRGRPRIHRRELIEQLAEARR